MKKMHVLLFASLVLALFCGCGDGGARASSSEPKPRLHVVEEGCDKFLADNNGVLLYSLQPPLVTIDVGHKIFVISPSGSYAPGTTYYGSSYDGFTVSCSYSQRGRPDASITFDFGPDAGEIEIPKVPYSGCSFQALVVDGEGTTFKTDIYSIFFTRGE